MINKFKTEISKYLDNSKNIFLHKKGRVSLYFLLKTMGIEKDDEIVIPAYTCVVVPNPIIYLGAKPIYVDIVQQTFNMDISKLEDAITPKTKVIICQNTYGLSSNIEEINSIAKKHGLYTIEDCTHGFGGKYNNKLNGTFCDASFFSTQWNKPFSSGIGGFALINNPELLEKANEIDKEKIQISFIQKLTLKILYFVRRFLITDQTYWFMVRFYRWLSKNNLILGSSSGEEISGVTMPANFYSDYSNVQAKEGLRTLAKLDKNLVLRKKNAKIYTEFLKSKNKNYVDEKLFSNHSFLKYPLLVNDREKFIELAEKSKIPVGDWFISPLHPIENNLETWFFDEEKFPIAVKTAKKVINLPTDTLNIDKVITFINNNLTLID